MKNWGKKVNDFRQPNSTQHVRFQSGMSSQQKYHSIAESVLSSISHTQVIKGCSMHPKLSKKCRKCQQIQKNAQIQNENKEQEKLDQNFPQVIKWNTSNFRSHFNQKLQKNIQESYVYKSKIKPITNIKDLSNSVTPDQMSIDAYLSATNDTPTEFICYLYRLAQLHPTRQQISIMLKANNVNVRCLILLYLRVYADPHMVYGCINHSFKDNKLLNVITIGEYAIRLFDQNQLNHGGFRIPRLPIKIQRQIDQRIAEFQQRKDRQFQRERSRSRQRKRKFLEEKAKQQSNKKQQSSSSSSSSSESELQDQKQQNQQNIKQEVEKKPQNLVLSLKEKIRLLQEKNKANQRRKALLQSYKAEKVENLESESDEYNQNDEVQKYKMG